MEEDTDQTVIELLLQLGLLEYEAKSFVALSRLPEGTAKEISELSEVPRTRVYDAVRGLERKGLVEIQHTNPKVYRAVSIDGATEMFRREYGDRIDHLNEKLSLLEPVSATGDGLGRPEVWTLTGETAIQQRMHELIKDATDEIVVYVSQSTFWTEELFDRLQTARRRNVRIIVGTTDELRTHVLNALPDVDIIDTDFTCINHRSTGNDQTEIRRLLLVDRETILVSSLGDTTETGSLEYAVIGHGVDNGFVAIFRRAIAMALHDS